MIQISKRGELGRGRALAIRAAGLVLGVLLCALVTLLATGKNPLELFSAMVKGSFGTPRKTWLFLQNTAILLMISLAVTPAFKMRCWNLGAEGQVLAGAMATTACMKLLAPAMPNALVILCMLITSVVCGAVWAGLPALFKARFNTNETLFTLMMNYVAMQIVSFFCVKWENPKGSCQIGIVNQSSRIGWLPEIGNRYLLPILVVILLTVFMFFYLNSTKHGFELTVVGESERTARYVGIKVGRVVVRTMLLSGAICGLTGFLLVGGIHHTVSTTLAGGQGFTAVMVSWLAKFNPAVMGVFSGLLIFLSAGATEVATSVGLNQSFGDMLTGILIFCIIGSEFFINYRLSFHKKNKEAEHHV
ncbi:MAG: ABC transporter permease [Oscillospiraceae bacterium]|nr:ABC transporter permease [Oscillospiraceae bacterium]